MRPLLAILGLWEERWPWLALGLAASLASLGAGLSLMTQSGATVAAAVAAGVLAAPLLLRVLGGLRVMLRYVERLTTHSATFRALADLRVWFFRGLSRSAAGGLGFQRSGDVLARLVGDVEALDGLYLRILVPLIGAAVLVVAMTLLLATRSLPLALAVCLLFAASAFLLPAVAARGARRSGAELAEASGALRTAALDAMAGLREVRAFGAEGRVLASVQAREMTLYAAERRVAWRTSLASAGAFLCGQAALLCVLTWSGAAPVPAIAAAFLVTAAFEAVGGLARAGALAGHMSAAASRVLQAGSAAPPVAEPARPATLPGRTDLRFEAVRFGWTSDRPPVLNGLTLEAPQGSRVAILGPSGSGKSTLAALALRLAAPQSGRVLLGGVDIATLSSAALRTRVAWLGQATHLFDDTIRANLLLARPDADEAALWAALDAARIGDMVRGLPDRLETWVGEGGSRFSGGEGRRLALARALLSPAPVLILDEPATGLDAETERAFFATLNETAQGRTIVLIAHRLTGVERLDRIWRLSAGRAVAAAG